ncbi:MAG: vWA domain-containing protein [Clostridia bacterium]
MKKKILSLSLTLCLLATIVVSIPFITNVFAAEDGSNSLTGGNADETNEGVSISKTVTYSKDDEGEYTYILNLESFTTGEVTRMVETATPTDIVLVLDQSTSMIWPLTGEENNKTNIGIYDLDVEGNVIANASLTVGNTTYTSDNAYLYSESRQKILIDAVTDFIESVKSSAENTGVEHRISIVTFNNGVATEYDLTTDYDYLIQQVDAWAIADNTQNDYDDKTTDYRYTFNLDDSTQIYLGVEEAEDTLSTALSKDIYGDYATEERQQVAVVFTDGEPTNTADSTYKYAMYNVNYTIDSALDMKSAGVDVFTIGLFSEADSNTDTDIVEEGENAVTSANSYGNVGSSINWETALNRFLDLTSSNYLTSSTFGSGISTSSEYWPDDDGTVTITSNFDRQATTEYYYGLSSQDTDEVTSQLASIFTTISSGLTSNASIVLDETTQVRDVMTNDFEIPEDSSNLTVSIVYATGVATLTDEEKEKYNEYDSEWYTWSDSAEILYENGDTTEDWGDIEVTLEDVTVYTVEKDTDGNIIYDADGNPTYTKETYSTQQVIVEGFDYNSYYVTEEPRTGDYTGDTTGNNSNITEFYGAKLVISFEIDPNSGVLDLDENDQDIDDDGYYTIGGNEIDTNHVTSGIYIYDNVEGTYSSLESFPVPTADIAINLDFSVVDQTIYLGNSISVAELLQIDGHAIMGVANKYVDIEFNVYEDGDNENSLLTVTILAGESIYDATDGTYDLSSLITPTQMTSYYISISVKPINDGGTVDDYTADTDSFNVYVLYPTVEANDIWVDYATPVNLREDNIIQVMDENGTYSVFDSIRITWDTYDTYTDDTGATIPIPEPNNAIPPTVTFGFTARRGIEYTATEFEEYGVREDKEFEISSMTVTSSDGYSNVSYFDMDDYTSEDDQVTFDVNINRFDLEISKTVEADVYDIYPQSFIFDINYTGSDFETTTDYATGPNGFVIFSRVDNELSSTKIYVDTDGYDDKTGEYTIYTNNPPTDSDFTESELYDGYYDITTLFFTGEEMNKTGDYIDLTTFTIYYASAPTANNYTSDAFVATTVIKTVDIEDVEKNIEVVVDPDMSNVETVEWYGGEDGTTRYYTFTTTVTDLYCGIEMEVFEETDWSWRYEPGFTTSTTTQYAEYSNISDYIYVESNLAFENETNGVRTTVNIYETEDYGSYTIVNVVSTDENIITTVRTAVFNESAVDEEHEDIFEEYGSDIDKYMETENVTPLSDTTSTMSIDADDNITQETRETVSTYKMADFDEIHSGEVTLNSAVNVGTSYDYYLTTMTFDSVAYVTTSSDASSATILVENSETYLDKNGSNTDYSSWERITELTYFGSELYSASEVTFTGTTITYTPSSKATDTSADIDEDGKVTISTETGEDYYIENIYYINDDGEKVYDILDDGTYLTPTTYYYDKVEPMTDVDGNPVYDTDSNQATTTTQAYAFQVIEIPMPVPAVAFDTTDVSLDVYNTLTENQWLSDSELIENIYDPLADPRVDEEGTND